MREIEFRAWDENEKLMVTPYFDGFKWYAGWRDMEDAIELQGEVMQYIGLKDKNGKKIFEGDIVESPGDFMPSVVSFEGGAFRFCDLPVTDAEEYEWAVIGNIYENPDLLDKEAL